MRCQYKINFKIYSKDIKYIKSISSFKKTLKKHGKHTGYHIRVWMEKDTKEYSGPLWTSNKIISLIYIGIWSKVAVLGFP